MPRFALLTRESSNRVYADRAPMLLTAELLSIAPTMHAAVGEVERRTLGNVEYVMFEADELDEHDRFIVSNLSSVRALFAIRDDDALIPQALDQLEYFHSDLITIQRYPGKTNEQFTHLLVNLTLAASESARAQTATGERVSLLDPVAGRGTTLNRALMYGLDAYGVEVNEPDVDQYRNFISAYLKDHRIKHKLVKEQIRKGELAGTSQFSVRIRIRQELRVARGEASKVRSLLPGRSFDAVVGDLPYGVQHRATSSKHRNRSAEELLAESLSAWRSAMRPGAALGLSWNLKTLPRQVVVELLETERFTVVEHPMSFEHVVDRSITRDLIVARR